MRFHLRLIRVAFDSALSLLKCCCELCMIFVFETVGWFEWDEFAEDGYFRELDDRSKVQKRQSINF